MGSNSSFFFQLYKESPRIRSEQWLTKTEEFIDKIFSGELDGNGVIKHIDLIKGHGGSFEKLIKSACPNNRMVYCRAIFKYCEMSQDWRTVGDWLAQEIRELEANVGVHSKNSEAWLYFAYGRYLEEIGKFNQSYDFHLKGIEVSQRHNDYLSLALNKLGIGITLQRFTNIQDIEKAVGYLIDAIKFFDENDSYQKANSLLNLGSCYDRLDKAGQAIEVYQECIHILQELNNQFDLGRAYYSLGIAYLNHNQFREAQKTFELGEGYCKSSKNFYYLSHIYYGYGWLEYHKNNYTRSQELLENSISSFNKYKEEYLGSSQVSYYESEGNIYLLAAASYCKKTPISEERVNHYLDRAENAYQQLEQADKKLAQVLANRARLYEATEQWETAISLFSQLLDKGKQLKQSSIISDAAIHLFRIYYRKRASILTWIKLLINLNIQGCHSLVLGFLQRQKRTQKIIQYLKLYRNKSL
jgi:tetratricopeptide (TPR) repeat protein